MLVLKGLVDLHRTVQLQLLQRYWLGHRLGLPGGSRQLMFLAPVPVTLLNENCLSSGIKGSGSAGWLAP